MRTIKKVVAKTKVDVLAAVGKEVVDYTVVVYGVTPKSRNFLEEVGKELGRTTNGKAELYRVVDATEVEAVTMVMDADIFKTYATIIENEDE